MPLSILEYTQKCGYTLKKYKYFKSTFQREIIIEKNKNDT